MESKETSPKKKSLIRKLSEATEDQLAVLSATVRLGILIWSGSILTLAYVKLPASLNLPEQDLDPTFIASVFTGVLATFGVQTTKKAQAAGSISIAELEKVIAILRDQNKPTEEPPVNPTFK